MSYKPRASGSSPPPSPTTAGHRRPRFPARPTPAAGRTYPMGFPALWKSFRTRSTSLLTLQSFPSTANVLLQSEASLHLRVPVYLQPLRSDVWFQRGCSYNYILFCFLFKEEEAWKVEGGGLGSKGEVGRQTPEQSEAAGSDCKPRHVVLSGLLGNRAQYMPLA